MWTDHTYSCDYAYKNGATMKMSVKELSSADETNAYYNDLARSSATRSRRGLGQGAFDTENGSVVVRKDYKVLTVDVCKLPAQFGDPPDTPKQRRDQRRVTIMGCWTGA